MNKHAFLWFLLTFSSFAAIAQSNISGKVLDILTHEPLPGASVQISKQGTVTDLEGKFRLSAPEGTQMLEVSSIGYETKSLPILVKSGGQNEEIVIELTDKSNLLQQTTVTAGKYEKKIGEETVSIEVMKPKFIESNASSALDGALDRVPGINIIDGQANIRNGSGFSYGAGSRVLLLQDDIPILQADAGFPNWNDIPIENISQVEIIKGAASALYGSSAMNGIINVRTGFAKLKPETEVSFFANTTGTPKDASQKWWGADTSEIQLPLETGLSIVHRRKEGKLDLVLSGNVRYLDSWSRQSYQRYYRFSPNFRYRFNDRVTAGVNINFNTGRGANFFIWGGDGALALQPQAGSITEARKRIRYTIDPYLHIYDKAGNRHKLLGRFYAIDNQSATNQSNSSQSIYSEYQFQKNWNDRKTVFTGGLVYSNSAVKAELYGDTTYTSNNIAAYVQLDHKITPRFHLSSGLRYERNALYSPEIVEKDTIPGGVTKEGKPVFRLGLNYQVAQATYLRASFGQGYRYPTIAEKFITTDFGIGNRVGPNAKLISETGWSAEIGIKQGLKLGKFKGLWDVAAYYSEYKDMMEFVLAKVAFEPPNIVAIFQSQNVGNTEIKGLETTLQGIGKIGSGELTLLTGYNFTSPKYKEFGALQKASSSDTTQNVLKYRFRHTLKLDAEYAWKKWKIGTNLNYFSFMQAIDLVFQDALPGVKTFRARNNKGTYVLDLRLGYQLSKQLNVYVIGKNIGNAEYSLRPARMEQPINYTLRLDWKF